MAKKESSEAERAAKVLDGWSKPVNERLPIIKWKAGDVIVGSIISTKQLPDSVDGKGAKKTGGVIFTFQTLDGERVCYGAPTILWETLQTLDDGAVLRIECLGKTIATKRGQNAWAFDVRVRE